MNKRRQGEKSQPQFYDQLKDQDVMVVLTLAGRALLAAKIAAYDPTLSRSEFIERLARGTLDPVRLREVFFP